MTAVAERSEGKDETRKDSEPLNEGVELLVKVRKLRLKEAKRGVREHRVSVIPQQVQSVLLVFNFNI